MSADPMNRRRSSPVSPRRREQSRREFLRSVGLAAAGVGVSLLGLVPVAGGGNARLRPPGALKRLLDEQQFLAACIKCGQCVQVCPVEAIKLADLTDGVGVGTPYIETRSQACDFSCDGLQCVLACPTGALTHDIDYPAQARMGFARLTRPESCLALQGKGFRGQARGASFTGKLRYAEVDRWNPIPVSGSPVRAGALRSVRAPVPDRDPLGPVRGRRTAVRGSQPVPASTRHRSGAVAGRRQADGAPGAGRLRRLRRMRDDLPGDAGGHRGGHHPERGRGVGVYGLLRRILPPTPRPKAAQA